MLVNLSIKNVALIDYAEIEFTKGLNVLSGETGSGKSVIIESLNFVLGAKADKNLIRSGQDHCFVSATFSLEKIQGLVDVFEELDIEYEDDCIISRKLTLEGKNTIKINGVTVTATSLRKLTSRLVDVHGQSEHYALLSSTNQLNLIDNIGKELILPIKNNVKQVYTEYNDVVAELNQLGGDEHSRTIRLDILNYQINEINNANVLPDEFDQLSDLKIKIKHNEKIMFALNNVKSLIDCDNGASDLLRGSIKSLSSILEFDDKYSALSDRIDKIYSDLIDVSDECENLISDATLSDLNVEQIEERLDLIKIIFKKYGGDYAGVEKFLLSAIEEKNKLENFTQLAQELLDKKTLLEKQLFSLYTELSLIRKQVASQFANNVVNELKELNMAKATFVVNFSELPSSVENCKFSPNGVDEVQFLFSANLGEPLKPLSEVISGGEMSRFMLAIKAQSAQANTLCTYIFDEIDAGISGNVAKTVAQKFARISKHVQIIAISHLPQISAMGDNNLLITKNEIKDKTITNVEQLFGESKKFEIIRLVGGSKDNQSAIDLATDLIAEADIYKNSL